LRPCRCEWTGVGQPLGDSVAAYRPGKAHGTILPSPDPTLGPAALSIPDGKRIAVACRPRSRGKAHGPCPCSAGSVSDPCPACITNSRCEAVNTSSATSRCLPTPAARVAWDSRAHRSCPALVLPRGVTGGPCFDPWLDASPTSAHDHARIVPGVLLGSRGDQIGFRCSARLIHVGKPDRHNRRPVSSELCDSPTIGATLRPCAIPNPERESICRRLRIAAHGSPLLHIPGPLVRTLVPIARPTPTVCALALPFPKAPRKGNSGRVLTSFIASAKWLMHSRRRRFRNHNVSTN
jgi:hypothetical protein